MEFASLRRLFEILCDHLEQESCDTPFCFQAAYGIEFQEGVVMVFVFDKGVLVYRFLVDDADFLLREPGLNTSLDMIQHLKEHKGGFRELFGSS